MLVKEIICYLILVDMKVNVHLETFLKNVIQEMLHIVVSDDFTD